MILKGEYTDASVFAETIDAETLRQIREIINQRFMERSKVAIMPDAHAGAGICIGFTATLNGKVVPNFVGVDIGCGVASRCIKNDIVFKTLDFVIRGSIPYGMNNNKTYDEHEIQEAIDQTDGIPENILYRVGQTAIKVYGGKGGDNRVYRQFGSLGGGNHFIAVNETSDGEKWLTVHSGSRNFGLTIARYHQDIARKNHGTSKNYKEQIVKIIRETPKGDVEKKLSEFRASQPETTSVGIAYLEGEDAENYFSDMETAQWFAKINRRMIINRIMKAMRIKPVKHDLNFVETVHNYIDFEDRIMRKGAVRAHEGENLLIPLSMKDGVLFCKGKGNPDWNRSAPHGAGRLMSRTQAKTTLTVSEYKRQMAEAGVWSTCIGKETLDESPMAYKDSTEIKRNIEDAVEILDHWKEVYNFKAAE
jgi:RNA-splicing ligase RtcB